MHHTAHIALGSNLGDRAASLNAALKQIAELPGTAAAAVSPFFPTPPVGPGNQGEYLNAAAELRTALNPAELLAGLLAIERSRGRDRANEQRWGPRTLDLDVLLFDELVLDAPGLTIPHPRMHERMFVLEPLNAIAPGATHPALNSTISQLLARLRSAAQ